MPGQDLAMQRLPLASPSSTLPSASTISGTTPKNGRVADPGLSFVAPGLPKTRSGKIMRRILRKIAEDESSSLGDTSTLADPAVVDDLVKNRQNKKGASA